MNTFAVPVVMSDACWYLTQWSVMVGYERPVLCLNLVKSKQNGNILMVQIAFWITSYLERAMNYANLFNLRDG